MRAIAVLLVLFSGVVHAEEDAVSWCRDHAETAKIIMTMRQQGRSMIEMMDIAASMGEFRKGSELLIRAAFDSPLMRSDEGKQREISEFSNRTMALCLDKRSPR